MVFTRLTTKDNPFDPFDQFDLWFEFDLAHKYNSCALLARIADTSSGSGLVSNEYIKVCAIDEIIDLFPDLYTKVERDFEVEQDSLFAIPNAKQAK